jgi:hypothetical protein
MLAATHANGPKNAWQRMLAVASSAVLTLAMLLVPNTAWAQGDPFGGGWQPITLAADPAGGVYVLDGGGSRVFHFSGTSTVPDRVYGCAATSRQACGTKAPPSASTLNGASNVAGDPAGGVYISDSGNYRILHYPGTSTTADRVYGQSDMTSAAVPQSRPDLAHVGLVLEYPGGLSADPSGGLYALADLEGHAVHYPGTSTTPDRVYGGGSTARGAPRVSAITIDSGGAGLAADPAGGLFVADMGNSRVLHFPSASTTADRVYGQRDFSTNGQASDVTGLAQPMDASPDGSGGLYIADYGNGRVTHYSAGSTAADRVYGGAQGDPKTSHLVGAVQRLSADPAGGLYVSAILGMQSYILHFPGTSLVADRAYADTETLQIIGMNNAPNPAPAPPDTTPDWTRVLNATADTRVNIVQCPGPSARHPAPNICVATQFGPAYAAIDQVTYGDIVGDGGTEALIPLDSGGSLARLDR